jgi:secreted trypsin-like serine protease
MPKTNKLSGVRTLLCSVVVTLLLINSETVIAQDSNADVLVSYELDNSATLQAAGTPPVNVASTSSLAKSIVGTEQSQCQPYGRRSSSSVTVTSSASQPQSNTLSGTMKITALALGGHYRTCAVPCDVVHGICVGIQGHDTQGTALGSVHLRARIAFGSQVVQDKYDIKLSLSQPEQMSIQLVGPDRTVISIAKDQRAIQIVAHKDDIFYLDVSMTASANNVGGCCSDAKDVTAQFDVKVERAPILTSNAGLRPYIVGGQQTSSYKYVVAILIDGKIHCTGTAVAKRTILTAAHCIHDFEQQIKDKRMTFIVGASVTDIQYGPLPIIDGTYPRGNDPIQYNPLSYIHDVGLLFAANDIPEAFPASKLHQGNPAWSDVEKQHLLFVGFGYNSTSDGDLVGVGIKREADWIPSDTDDWRFYYNSKDKHACMGDSGGPAFYMVENTQELLLVGITSVGQGDCTGIGADTRIDAHQAWLGGHIR